MTTFTAQDALRSRWKPEIRPRAVRVFAVLGVLGVIAGIALLFVAGQIAGLGYLLALLVGVVAGLTGLGLIVAACAVAYAAAPANCGARAQKLPPLVKC